MNTLPQGWMKQNRKRGIDMKILILHLSDMHFSKKNSFNDNNITSIISALQQHVRDVEHVIILVSGDLAFSGKKGECIQASCFLNRIKDSITQRYGIHDVVINVVPGNHDIDYTNGDLGNDGLGEIEKTNNYEEYINKELEKQRQFFVLAQKYQCFVGNYLVQQMEYEYGGKKVQINLINTAIFSSLENDQGYHYLPQDSIDTLKQQGDSDYIITVMHHPHHWYSESCKKVLESALYTRSDIVFVGHEHYESTQKIEGDRSSINIFAGGRLCDRGDWTDSEFHVGVLDLETREYLNMKYHWNDSAKIYECNENNTPISLSKDRYNIIGLTVSPEYENELYVDKYILANNALDYFVFPLLVEERINEENGVLPDEISNIEMFFKKIQGKQKIIINGHNGSGKSLLARALYREISLSRLVLFVEGKKYTGSNEGTIKDTFERMFSKKPSDYQAFLQVDPESIAVVVDDIDAINDKKQEGFIDYLTEHFGLIIMTCQSEIDVDIMSRLKKRISLEDGMFFHIARFYSNKRRELVANVVRCVVDGDIDSQEKTIELLCEALTALKYLYSWNPDFIVQFVKYYCKNVGEASTNDGNVFSKVFEANLVSLIKPFAKKDLSVEKILVVLDKIAYYIVLNKKYPISVTEIENVITNYNSRYGSNIETFGFITIMRDARILKEYGKGFLFYERNYLAYFAAREIKRECTEGRYDQFQRVLDNSYLQINTDILMFITYIVDSPSFIRSIMKKAGEVVNEWEEYDFSKNDIKFLIGTPEQAIGPVTEDDVDSDENLSVQHEKEEEVNQIVKNDATIFEGETEDLSFVQQMMRAISLMIIVARTLPSFEQIMEIEEKKQCVSLIYKMPLLLFHTLVKQMDNDSGDLIKDIKDYHDYVYRKEKAHIEELTDEKALAILRWETSSMLLELMNSAFANATRPNTLDFIDAFPYKDKQTYQIEHLMSLERRDDLSSFKKEAIELFEKTKLPVVRSYVQRVTKHFIVKSKKIKPGDRDQLNTKIFGSGMNRAKLLAETKRYTRKN